MVDAVMRERISWPVRRSYAQTGLRIPKMPNGTITCAAVAPDSSTIAIAHYSGLIRIFGLTHRRTLAEFNPGLGVPYDFAYVKRGSVICVQCHWGVAFYSATTGQLVCASRGLTSSMSISADKKFVVVGFNYELYEFDCNSMKVIARITSRTELSKPA